MKSPYKELAEKFLPNRIRYLLIGESPPYTPPNEELKYFYNYRNRTCQGDSGRTCTMAAAYWIEKGLSARMLFTGLESPGPMLLRRRRRIACMKLKRSLQEGTDLLLKKEKVYECA